MCLYEDQGIVFFFFFLEYPSFIQLTPQKQSAGRENPPGAPGAGEWPDFFLSLISYNSHHNSRAQSRETVLLVFVVCGVVGCLRQKRGRGFCFGGPGHLLALPPTTVRTGGACVCISTRASFVLFFVVYGVVGCLRQKNGRFFLDVPRLLER